MDIRITNDQCIIYSDNLLNCHCFRFLWIYSSFWYGDVKDSPITSKITNQADVIQLFLVMFKNEYHPIVRLVGIDYYNLRTEHGSGDNPNVYEIEAAQVGRLDQALWYFLRWTRIYLESSNSAVKANFKLGGV